MNTLRTLGSIALVFLAGCTALTSADDQKDKDHLRHHPPAATAPAAMKSEQQMAQMREMHRKMMAARTPRNARR